MPSHVTPLVARNDMKMDVVHGLAGLGAIELADENAVRVQGFLHRFCDPFHLHDQRLKRGVLDLQNIARRGLGHDQDMAARLRENVHEGHRVIVLMHDDRRGFPAQDLREDILVVVFAFKAHICLLSAPLSALSP